MGWLTRIERAVNTIYGLRHEPLPPAARRAAARIVAHRGAHDVDGVTENTMAAFARAAALGVWGIELDVRFTADAVPVVLHDADAGRVFGRAIKPAELKLDELRRELPDIPTLAEVVGRFGRRLHLMLEIKLEAWPNRLQRATNLRAALGDLEPGRHYHVLALDAEVFVLADFVPAAARIAVSETNTARMSRLALTSGWGGLAGHFALISNRCMRQHQEAGQRVGTGFAANAATLWRELNRGVDWIFTNHPERLLTALAAARGPRTALLA